jgi:hypothetical protein
MITGDPVDTTVTTNDTLTLNCTAVNNIDAANPLSFLWFRDVDVLPETRQVVVDARTVTSVLEVPSVTMLDAGMYQCGTTNAGPLNDERSDSAVVTVNC